MTIDSLTLENVIRNLEKAKGMEQDINSSLRSARNGLHSGIAHDVKDIKIENNCSTDINLASQIHDAFVSIEGGNVDSQNSNNSQFDENNNQNRIEDTRFSEDVIIKAENANAESTGDADSINGEQKKGESIVASEANQNASNSPLPNSANSASGVYNNSNTSQTTGTSPTSSSTVTETSNSQASVQAQRDAMLRQIDNSVGGFDAPKEYSFDTSLSSNIPEEENASYADLSDIFGGMETEQQVDLLKSVYTDEYIDALDIDADLKEMLKNCVHNNNIGSFMLAVEIINTTEDLKAAQLKQEECDRLGNYEQSRLAKQEVTALTEKLLELNSQIELMQYVDYFGEVSETELQYSYDLLEAISLDEKGFPNINPLAYDMSTDNASRFMSYLMEGYYGELIKNIDYDINDDISPLQKIDLVKSIIEKLKTEYGFNPSYDFELVYADNLEMMATEHFTVQERNVYEKIYREEGAEAATKFLNSMKLTLNNREGWKLAKEYYNQVISGKTTVSRLLETGLIGINNGVVSHFENLHSFIFQDITKTSNEYASDYFTQLLMEGYVAAQMGEISSNKLLGLKNNEFINQDQFDELRSLSRQRKREGRELSAIDVMFVAGYYDMDMYSYMQNMSQSPEFKNFVNTQSDVEEYLAKNCYSAGSSIGNMLPSIAMSIALSPLGGAFTLGESTVTWGQIAANVSMFSSSATGSWKEAMRKGHTMGDSILYGIANGGSETLTGFFIGRVPFVSRFSSALEKLGGSGSHVLIQAAINLGKDILGEVTEEVVQLPLGGIFDTVILGEDVNWSEIAAQIPDTIVSTVISTGVTNGAPVTLQLGGYAVNVSVNDISAIANSKNSKEMLAALVGAKVNPNAIVASLENTNLNEAQIAYVVSRLRTDKARISGLQYVTNDIARTRIVQTFLTDNAKLSALQYITTQENQEAIVRTLSKENQLKALEIYPDLNIEGIADTNDAFTPTEERIQQDKTEISAKIQGFINQIFTEFATVIPQNIKDTLGNIQNIEDIVHIDETGTISLYVNNGEVYLPKNAYTVLNLLSKIPGFGSKENHTTHTDTNMVINNNTFLNFVSHVFLKGLTPEQYFSEIALHETMHLCGSDGSWGLFEGLTEFKTRELAQKYGLETSACGYPKETRIAYELQQLFGKEVMDKVTFAPNEGGVNAVETKYQIILEFLGEEEAELFLSVVSHMQTQFNPYITKSYPGLLGILNKCYQYSKIDYSKVYDMINQYRINHGLEVVDFTKTDISASDLDSLYAGLLNGTVETYNPNSDLNTEQVGNVMENMVEITEVEVPYQELSEGLKQEKLKELLSNPIKFKEIVKNGSFLGVNIETVLDDIFNIIDSGNTDIIPSDVITELNNSKDSNEVFIVDENMVDNLVFQLLYARYTENTYSKMSIIEKFDSEQLVYYCLRFFTDDNKNFAISELINNKLQNQELKMKALEYLTDDYFKKAIIDTFTEKYRAQSIKYLNEQYYKNSVINSITDMNILKSLILSLDKETLYKILTHDSEVTIGLNCAEYIQNNLVVDIFNSITDENERFGFFKDVYQKLINGWGYYDEYIREADLVKIANNFTNDELKFKALMYGMTITEFSQDNINSILSTITNPNVLAENLMDLTDSDLIEQILEIDGVKEVIIKTYDDNNKFNLISLGLKDNQFLKNLIISIENKNKYASKAMLFVKDGETFTDLLKNNELFNAFCISTSEDVKETLLFKITSQDVFVKFTSTIYDPSIVYSAIYNYNLDEQHQLELIKNKYQIFDDSIKEKLIGELNDSEMDLKIDIVKSLSDWEVQLDYAFYLACDFEKVLDIIRYISNNLNGIDKIALAYKINDTFYSDILLEEILNSIDFNLITVDDIENKFSFSSKEELAKFSDFIADKLIGNEQLLWSKVLYDAGLTNEFEKLVDSHFLSVNIEQQIVWLQFINSVGLTDKVNNLYLLVENEIKVEFEKSSIEQQIKFLKQISEAGLVDKANSLYLLIENDLKNELDKSSIERKRKLITSLPVELAKKYFYMLTRLQYVEDINKYVESKEDKFEQQIIALSNRWGTTYYNTWDILNEKIRELVKDGVFGIRKKLPILKLILQSGIVKNQFETGTSEGANDPDLRRRIEMEIINTPTDISYADRPVYGMVFPSFSFDDTPLEEAKKYDYYKNGPGRFYGNLSYAVQDGGCIILYKKENIIDNITVSLGDSLDYSGQVISSAATNPMFAGAHFNFGYNINSVDEFRQANLMDLFPMDDQYLELQFHGIETHVIDNIDEIWFIAQPDQELIDMMSKLNIKWKQL